MTAVWLGWITMRGDDREIDNVLMDQRRRTTLHLFQNDVDRRASCGTRRPADDSHLGLLYLGPRCRRCLRSASS